MKNTVSNDQIRRSVRAICLSGVSISLGAISGPSLAQTADTVSAPQSDELAEITVTGIRASLQKSLDIKENSVGVVDAISAEDIGQFPDSNLAAAIQRIPGVSVSRGTSSMGSVPTTTGDATEITVRGFGPQFNETLYDGRQASVGTQGRGFDFSSVGADFVDEVDILKTPDASLSSGAIGATINIKYPKPFDYPGFKLASSVSGSYSPDDGKYTPNGGLLVSDSFADNTFGILADFAYSDHKVRENHVNIQGWPGFLLAPSQLAGAPAGASTVGSLPSWEIQDYGVYQEHTEDQRVDGRLVMQWRPMEALLVTVNDDYSRDRLQQTQAGYSVWFNSGGITDAVRSADGTLTSYVQNNTPTDFQGQINGSVIRNNEFGANVAWDVTEHFKAVFDADQANSRLNPNGELSSIDSDVGYGPSTPGNTINGGNVGIAGIGVGSLPYPTTIGPNGNAALFINNGIIGSHVFPISQPNADDTVNQFKVSGEWTGDHIKAAFGFQYIDDTKNLKEFDDFQNNEWQSYAGYGPASGNTGGVALPQSFFTNSFTTGSNFIPGFSNNGKLPAAILSFNPINVLNYLQGLGNPQAMNIPGFNYGAVPDYAGAYTTALSVGSVQRVEEKTLAPFVSISEDQQIAGMTLKEKIGARYEETNVYTAGLGQEPTSLAVQPSDHTAFVVGYGPVSKVQNVNTYRYLLPSLDLNLQVTDSVKVRFDASRTLTRPPLNDLTPVTTVAQGQRTNSLQATGGNPGLLPFLSDNLDIGAEWYYARNSYLSADAFVKEVTNFIVGGTTTENINGVTDPTKANAPAQFSVTTQVNGPSAEVRGLELGIQHVFWDTGFGFSANATFVGTNKPYNPNDISVSGFAITGIGDSANFAAFYEKYGFHSRVAVNWRAEYLDHFGQQQNTGSFGAEPTFVNANTQVDLSASYDITKNFDVYFEGLNLNNSTYSTHGRFPEQVLDVIAFGPRYTVGVHFRL